MTELQALTTGALLALLPSVLLLATAAWLFRLTRSEEYGSRRSHETLMRLQADFRDLEATLLERQKDSAEYSLKVLSQTLNGYQSSLSTHQKDASSTMEFLAKDIRELREALVDQVKVLQAMDTTVTNSFRMALSASQSSSSLKSPIRTIHPDESQNGEKLPPFPGTGRGHMPSPNPSLVPTADGFVNPNPDAKTPPVPALAEPS